MSIYYGKNKIANSDSSGGGSGKSAYEYAVDGGFTGTEQEFAELLGSPPPSYLNKLCFSENINPDNTGYSTLFEYLQQKINSENQEHFFGQCFGFSDLPQTDWGFGFQAFRGEGDVFDVVVTKSWQNKQFLRQFNTSGWITNWTMMYNSDNKPTAADIGAYPSSGGIVNGWVTVDSGSEKAVAQMFNAQNTTFIRNQTKNSNKYIDFRIPNNEDAPLSDSVYISKGEINVGETFYRLYGEHNKPTPADIGAVKRRPGWAPGNFNDFIEDGRYELLGWNTNTPYGDGECHFHLIVFRHKDDWVRQLAFDVRTLNTYIRAKTNGVWSAWSQLLDQRGSTLWDGLAFGGGRGYISAWNDGQNSFTGIEAVNPASNRIKIQQAISNSDNGRWIDIWYYSAANDTWTWDGLLCPTRTEPNDITAGSTPLLRGQMWCVYQ